MNTYQNHLLRALREENIPGPRIAEALAEVDSHVAETGDDPRDAFGDPETYARRLSEVLGGHKRAGWFWLLHWTWQDGVVIVVTWAGGALMTAGLFGLGAGRAGPLGLPAAVSVVVGLVVLAGVFTRTVIGVRRLADPVVDPRTGKDMAPLPRWVLPAMAVPLFIMFVLVYLLGVFSR